MKRPILLIADDDENICDLIIEIACEQGYDCNHVQNGMDFAAAFTDSRPDVVFLDLRLPGKDGVELLEYLGEERATSKVILMSGMDTRTLSSARKLAHFHNINLVALLQKPVPLSELENLLSRLIPAETVSAITAEDVTQGIENSEFDVFYQPKILVAKGCPPELRGVEALARWKHPVHGWVPPDLFIPVAEKAECIGALTDYIFARVIEDMFEWKHNGVDMVTSVNMSQSLLCSCDIAERYEKIASARGINTCKLIFEVTETSIMADPAKSLSVLTRVRLKGFGLSLDDFGTGYSSMTHLYRMPINELKIDRMFVADALHNDEAREIVQFMIKLGESLNLDVCVEGVEDADTLKLFTGKNSILVQGFHFSKPLPNSEILSFVKRFATGQNASPLQKHKSAALAPIAANQ